ncbi:hypothetical protein [Paenibacillus protaetiae]|uniref:Hydrolase n=1 Tax=Paenibacillus protaetiae TaxID=2509456 RepID=A0A4P6EQL8_9BACL|nr:hypothetical protein [Paenibacillus protaetiae]QAY65132.1 hypothetical protein ET464_00740 [Paenibacillus protaetiae]
MAHDEYDKDEIKTYYVSVQAGQVLEDPHSTSYELVIRANAEQYARLQELFGELSSIDEAGAGAYSLSVFHTDDDRKLNSGYDDTVEQIYRLLYECGTAETKAHIESMGLF